MTLAYNWKGQKTRSYVLRFSQVMDDPQCRPKPDSTEDSQKKAALRAMRIPNIKNRYVTCSYCSVVRDLLLYVNVFGQVHVALVIGPGSNIELIFN
jgi:hypothetical protein